MARMSIDDKIGRDPRVTRLARMLGWSKRELVGCLVLEVWPLCYDGETAILDGRDIDDAVNREGFAADLVEAGLGEACPDGIRVAGAAERIEYLLRKREAGKAGGIASTRQRMLKQAAKHSLTDAQATCNPPDLVPDLPSALVPDPATPILKKNKRSSARKASADISPYERSVIEVVLAKLGNQTGVRYMGGVAHQRLIAARLREGVSECDLRKVICYCADKLEWRDDPKMAAYLRPETLFGPQTIARYLDAARTWFETLGPEDQPVPEAAVPPNEGAL